MAESGRNSLLAIVVKPNELSLNQDGWQSAHRKLEKAEALPIVRQLVVLSAVLIFSLIPPVQANVFTSTQINFNLNGGQRYTLNVNFGGADNQGNGERAIVNTTTLLRMNDGALRQLSLDYVEVTTYDGFWGFQTNILIRAILSDRSYIRRFINRLSNVRGEKFRIKILDQEINRNQKRLKELRSKIENLDMVYSEKSRALRKQRLKKPLTRKERTYVRLRIEEINLENVQSFLKTWRDTPNSGPGGSKGVKE